MFIKNVVRNVSVNFVAVFGRGKRKLVNVLKK